LDTKGRGHTRLKLPAFTHTHTHTHTHLHIHKATVGATVMGKGAVHADEAVVLLQFIYREQIRPSRKTKRHCELS